HRPRVRGLFRVEYHHRNVANAAEMQQTGWIMREPFWRAQTGYWYIEQNGKQVRLSKLGDRDPDGATRKYPPPAVQNEWHRIMREGIPEDMQLGDLFVAFIASLPEGSDNRVTTRRQLGRFERFVGREMKVSRLKPIKLTEYL